MENKRNVILINRPFQIKIVSYFIGLALTNILIFYGCIHYFFWGLEKRGLDAGLHPDHVFFLFVSDQHYIMSIIFLVVAVLNIGFLIIMGLLISHKVAGPLYRLKSHLLDISRTRRLEKISFRQGDFFPELEDAFNKYVENSQEKPNDKAHH